MSIRFNASNLQRTTSLPTVDNLTVAFWLYLVVDQNAVSAFFTISDAGDDSIWIGTTADGTTLQIYIAASFTANGPSLNLAQWYHIGFIRNGTTNTLYVDGVQVATGTKVNVITAPTQMAFGAYFGATQPSNCRLASLKIWNAALTLGELITERTSVNPLRVLNLNNFLPALDSTDLMDTQAGSPWTAVNALTTEANPPFPSLVYLPHLQRHILQR